MAKKRSAFLPPVRSNAMSAKEMLRMQELKAHYYREMTQASNNSFNLGVSAAIIAARDMGMSIEEAKEFIKRIFGMLDDVADELTRIEEMLSLVSSWGIDVYNTAKDKTTTSGKVIEQKTAVFYLLQEGVTEIEDILTKCKLHNINIDYRDACAYRWEFNRKKYYEDMDADMSKKDEAFKLLDEGLSNTELVDEMGISRAIATQYRYLWSEDQEDNSMSKKKEKAFNLIEKGATKEQLVNELGITDAAAIRFLNLYRDEKCDGEIEVITGNMKKAFELFDSAHSVAQVVENLKIGKETAEKYKFEWIRINKRNLTSEEMAEVLAEETPVDIVILRHKGVLPQRSKKKQSEQLTKSEQLHKTEENAPVVGEIKEDLPEKGEIVEENKGDVKEMAAVKKGLRKIVKVIAIEGDMATYEPLSDGVFSVNIGDQVIILNKQEMKNFAEELVAIAEDPEV